MSVTLGTGFAGLATNTTLDPNGAIGPNHIVHIYNRAFDIFGRDGTHISTTQFSDFFAALPTERNTFDPTILYDSIAGRWIICASCGDLFEAAGSANYIYLAVSDTSDPTGLWTEKHAVQIDNNGQYWADFPRLGYNHDAIVISAGAIPQANSGAVGTSLLIVVDKSSVLDANVLTFLYYLTIGGTAAAAAGQPAAMHGSVAGDPMWIVSSGPGANFTLIKLTNYLSSSPVATSYLVAVNSFTLLTTAGFKQPTVGTNTTPASRTASKCAQAEWNNNQLVTSIMVQVSDGGGGQDQVVNWYDFNTSGTPTKTQEGQIHPSNGTCTGYGTITVTSGHDMGFGYLESSSTEHLAMYVTGRKSGDSLGTMQTAVLAKGDSSGGDYALTAGLGDYLGMGLDPNGGDSFVFLGMYCPTLANTNTGTARTWIQEFNFPATGPTVATAASATPNPITASTTALSVLGADSGGEPGLTYTWSAVGPAGAILPTYSANGTNGAKNSTATVYQAGSYVFTCTIINGSNQSITSNVSVTANQTATSVSIEPPLPTVPDTGTQQFIGSVNDQFGMPIANQTLTWSVTGGGVGGTINPSGLYTAPSSGTGTDTVHLVSGSLSANDTVTVIAATPAPTGLTATEISAKEVDLSWSESISVDMFTIQRSTNKGAVWNNLGTSATTSFKDKTTAKNKTYQYRVYASKSGVNSAYSNTVIIKVT